MVLGAEHVIDETVGPSLRRPMIRSALAPPDSGILDISNNEPNNPFGIAPPKTSLQIEQRMEYGPEHSKLIRQAFDEQIDPTVPGRSKGQYQIKGAYPRLTCLRERPNLNASNQAKPRQDFFGKSLGFLCRQILGRYLRSR